MYEIGKQDRAIVDHDVELGLCCHVNAGAIVKAVGTVESYRKLEASEVVLRERMIVADSNDEFAREYREQTGKEVSFF